MDPGQQTSPACRPHSSSVAQASRHTKTERMPPSYLGASFGFVTGTVYVLMQMRSEAGEHTSNGSSFELMLQAWLSSERMDEFVQLAPTIRTAAMMTERNM